MNSKPVRRPHAQVRNTSRACLVIFVAALPLFFTACSTYAPQAGSPTAKLRMITDDGNLTTFWLMPDPSSCPEAREKIAQLWDLFPGQKSELKMIGTAAEANQRIAEKVIEAGRPFVMEVGSGITPGPYTPGYHCDARFSFVPQAKGEYEIKYSFKDHKCGINLTRLVDTGAPNFRREFVPLQRVEKTCFKR